MPLRAEAPFVLPVAGTVLRGNIDLLASRGHGAAWSSTTRPTGSGSDGTAALGDRYAAQRAVYALAAARRRGSDRPRGPRLPRATGRAGGRGLRPARPGRRPAAARGADRADPRRASSSPRAEPYAALCFGCPAAPRLCPRPTWRPAPRRAGGAAVSRLADFGYGSLVSRASDRRDARPRRGAADPRPPRRLAPARGRSSATTLAPRRGSSRSRAIRSTSASASTSSARPERPRTSGRTAALIELTARRARPARPPRASLRPRRGDRRRPRDGEADAFDAVVHLHGEARALRCAHPPPLRRPRLLPAGVRGGVRRAGPGRAGRVRAHDGPAPVPSWRPASSATRSRRATRAPGEILLRDCTAMHGKRRSPRPRESSVASVARGVPNATLDALSLRREAALSSGSSAWPSRRARGSRARARQPIGGQLVRDARRGAVVDRPLDEPDLPRARAGAARAAGRTGRGPPGRSRRSRAGPATSVQRIAPAQRLPISSTAAWKSGQTVSGRPASVPVERSVRDRASTRSG